MTKKKEQTFIEKVSEIQRTIKAPKGQFNSFGKYKYRSVEDILEAVKPVVTSFGLVLTVSDEIVVKEGRHYVRATSMLTDGEKVLSVDAYAREDVSKKGMDLSQLTGSCSSYARKYSISGLLCIDSSEPDADSMDNRQAPKQERRIDPARAIVSKAELEQDFPSPKSGAAGTADYIPQSGKFKSKKLKECKVEELQNYVNWADRLSDINPYLKKEIESIAKYLTNLES